MKPFTVLSNAILFHHALAGIMLIHDQNPVEWINLTDDQKFDYNVAVIDFDNTNIESLTDWFAIHWKLFPFGEPNFENLSIFQQELVEGVTGFCGEMTVYYGDAIRGANE
jgi:hypothetical protein